MSGNKIDNPDVLPQQTWYNYGGVAPSVSLNISGDAPGTTAVTTINLDTGIAITGPVVLFTGAGSGFSFNGTVPATATLVSPLTVKGDLYTRTSTVGTRLPVGTNGFVLTARSGEATGLKWEAASNSGDSLDDDLMLMGG